MNNNYQIHHSTKYDLFQYNEKNRKTSPSHVKSFIEDKQFPKKFPTCPILVDKDLCIIDGQHRFKAAQSLGIPIYYIIDETADENDIVIRNSRMKPWKQTNYIDFYAAQGKKSYIVLKEIVEKYKIPYSCLSGIITKLGKIKNFHLSYMLKTGELNIKEQGLTVIKDLCDLIFPILKDCISQRSRNTVLPLFTTNYMTAYAHYFIEDEKLLKRFLKKIFLFPQFPFVRGYEDGRNMVKKIANWNVRSQQPDLNDLDI